MKALNRHHTFKWKKRRKEKHRDRCGNPRCIVCSPDKIFRIPTIQQLKADDKFVSMLEEIFNKYPENEKLKDEGFNS